MRTSTLGILGITIVLIPLAAAVQHAWPLLLVVGGAFLAYHLVKWGIALNHWLRHDFYPGHDWCYQCRTEHAEEAYSSARQ